MLQGKYKQAKEAYEQFVQCEGIEDTHKATAHKQLGKMNVKIVSLLYEPCHEKNPKNLVVQPQKMAIDLKIRI